MRGRGVIVLPKIRRLAVFSPPHQSAPLTASPPKGEAFFNQRFIYISKRALYKGFRIVYDMRVGTEKTFGAKPPGKDALKRQSK